MANKEQEIYLVEKASNYRGAKLAIITNVKSKDKSISIFPDWPVEEEYFYGYGQPSKRTVHITTVIPNYQETPS